VYIIEPTSNRLFPFDRNSFPFAIVQLEKAGYVGRAHACGGHNPGRNSPTYVACVATHRHNSRNDDNHRKKSLAPAPSKLCALSTDSVRWAPLGEHDVLSVLGRGECAPQQSHVHLAPAFLVVFFVVQKIKLHQQEHHP